jgi:nitrogen regulatory protein P-II 1
VWRDRCRKEIETMKRIEAITRPEKLKDVLAAIEKVGYSGIMITEIQGHGKQKGLVQQWRGETYRVQLLPKVRIEVIVADSEVKKLVTCIEESARTGEIGDGKIFISPVDDAVRIRTGETGEQAI